jgi:hypothetical protein
MQEGLAHRHAQDGLGTLPNFELAASASSTTRVATPLTRQMSRRRDREHQPDSPAPRGDVLQRIQAVVAWPVGHQDAEPVVRNLDEPASPRGETSTPPR